MGVPKFFRWMSERYPAISQLIAETRIPEFDCLYLDMNGIIHNCTHSDSDSATHRKSEEDMFIAIFNYIEHLFAKIKPQKLFFMAIDGVAPRAKMNQQRARRFRTALDAEKAREKAIKQGIQMPKEDPFDSNCITPGTEFMAKLTRQLKYFIHKKITEDKDWQDVEVVLSGHEVPGEGEHKIMEYIRLAKAQPGYHPNTRHCLYGLDADLIMLGLLSHDPHFCLLREEVNFGRQSSKKSKELEHQNFYLMHLCIVREYLELEFQELRDTLATTDLHFDLERIIDDFILMAFFVGNDFLPNLPNLHINEGALALMFQVYKRILKKTNGYINDGGIINVPHLMVLLDELQDIEYRFFEAENADASWFKGKQLEKPDVMSKPHKNDRSATEPLTLSSQQKHLLKQVKEFVLDRANKTNAQSLDMSSNLPAKDRKFVQTLAEDLHVDWRTVEDETTGDRHLQLRIPAEIKQNTGDDMVEPFEDDDEADEESMLAVQRILRRYDQAPVVDLDATDVKLQAEQKYEQKFKQWKDDYYKDKFEWSADNEIEMQKLTENYLQGLQWVLLYYYRRVASWPWYYNYHYAPMISDIKKGVGANLEFELGQPFRPYQQLMGVLPDRSKSIVPKVYHDLMTNPDSPIIDFYPRDFKLDMNGKKQDWEAVVKIPFIEEDRLLRAMSTRDPYLSPTEQARNEFGVPLKFTHAHNLDFTYQSSLPGVFPDLEHCRCVENIFDLPMIDGLDFRIGLMDGVKVGKHALAGFPSLKTLPHHGALLAHSVNVFQQDSRNESMVINILESDHRTNIEYAKSLLGKRVFVGYPFLSEAKVVLVSDELFDYHASFVANGSPENVPHSAQQIDIWNKKVTEIERTYSKRLGMITGQIQSLVHVEMLTGLKRLDDGSTVKEYALSKNVDSDYATQMIVPDVISEDRRFLEQKALPVDVDLPLGLRAFCLGSFGYGRPLEVIGHANNKLIVIVAALTAKEADFATTIIRNSERLSPYTPSFAVARALGLNSLVLSKITASLSVMSGSARVNLGLNLKFESKKLKVLGYSRRNDNGWEFSQKAVAIIQQYMIRFPEFIAGIQRNPKGDIYKIEDFYPAEIAEKKIDEILSWLKTIESKGLEKVPLDAEQLDSEVVMELQQAADAAFTQAVPVQQKKLHGVPRKAILKPSDAAHRLGSQVFAIGDRVVYALDSGRVPIASRGTVIGLTRTTRDVLLDVLFDTTFMSGTTLNDRCSPFRGSTVPSSAVLNISYRQLEVGANARETPRPEAARPGSKGSRMATQLGELRPAEQRPQLFEGWRKAVVGSASLPGAPATRNLKTDATIPYRPAQSSRPYSSTRMAQKGGLHYSPIDKGDFDPSIKQRNPAFKPTNHNSVPPPTSLGHESASGRGRGALRGGRPFRGRGGQRNGKTRESENSAVID